MPKQEQPDRLPALARRDLIAVGAAAVGLSGLALTGIGGKMLGAQSIVAPPLPLVPLAPTPGCRTLDAIPYEEGPYYAPNSPPRSDFRLPGRGGQTISVGGTVRDTLCRPVPGAVIDIWQTDPQGRYDNVGFDYRGHFYADEQGRYRFVSSLPHSYWFEGVWRTQHIHMKAQGADTRLLTTQMFFPFDPESNARHIGFEPRLLGTVLSSPGQPLHMLFDLVLEVA